jgi:hypothetical protein
MLRESRAWHMYAHFWGFVCVCVCVCACVRVYIRPCAACVQTCANYEDPSILMVFIYIICTYTLARTHIFVCEHITEADVHHIRVEVCVHACVCVRTCVCVCGRTCIHTGCTSTSRRRLRLPGVQLGDGLQREHRRVEHRASDVVGRGMRRFGQLAQRGGRAWSVVGVARRCVRRHRRCVRQHRRVCVCADASARGCACAHVCVCVCVSVCPRERLACIYIQYMHIYPGLYAHLRMRAYH